MSTNADLVLMDEDRLFRSLNRMAHEIAEQNTDNRPIVLFGIDERGFAVASALNDILQPMFEKSVQSFSLLYKDGGASDRERSFSKFQEMGIANSFLIVVDDVIFSGQTMFAALKDISRHLDPPEIHTAVLIDRGHRKFPIKAEYYGMELPTKLNEHVSVKVDGTMLKGVNLVNSKQ